MTGMPGRSGRKTFVPTPEQRKNVKVLAGSGMPQEQICQLVINPQTGKPLDVKTLRKHFKRELAIGEIELHAMMHNFMVATIFGVAPPAGAAAIDNQHVRGSLAKFFARTRMGWKEPVENRQKEPVDGPIEYQGGTSVRELIRNRIERLSQCHRLAQKTEGSNPCPSDANLTSGSITTSSGSYVKEAEVLRDQAVRQKQIDSDRTLQVATIEQQRTTEIAGQEKAILVARKSEEESQAEARANEARAESVKAEQLVITEAGFDGGANPPQALVSATHPKLPAPREAGPAASGDPCGFTRVD